MRPGGRAVAAASSGAGAQPCAGLALLPRLPPLLPSRSDAGYQPGASDRPIRVTNGGAGRALGMAGFELGTKLGPENLKLHAAPGSILGGSAAPAWLPPLPSATPACQRPAMPSAAAASLSSSARPRGHTAIQPTERSRSSAASSSSCCPVRRSPVADSVLAVGSWRTASSYSSGLTSCTMCFTCRHVRNGLQQQFSHTTELTPSSKAAIQLVGNVNKQQVQAGNVLPLCQ
jgi:hypothetical protein